MEKIVLEENELSPAYVKNQLDEILAREVTSLIEIDSEAALLTYNLSTISAIQVAVEREREIKVAKGFPPERYTIDSLCEELEALGLTRDETLSLSLTKILDQGYLSKNKLGELKAEVSAYTIVGFLDRMFPGMQGIQLVAFVLQMTDEVLSKRKSLEDAKSSFAQTLKKSGVSVTRETAEKKAKEIAEKKSDGQIKAVARQLKEDNVKRLALLRFKERQHSKDGGKPAFHFDGGSRIDKVKITSIFDKGPSKEELEAEQREKEAEDERLRIEEQRRAAELEAQQLKLKEAEEAAEALERKAAELAQKEQELESAKLAAVKLEQAEAELKAKQAEMAMKEAELRLKEQQLKAEAEAKERALEEERLAHELKAREEQDREAEKKAEEEKRLAEHVDPPLEDASNTSTTPQLALDPDDIEARIAAFESELATPCPICHTGKVKSETTDAGKRYFICSDSACRFVSWSQPYHFPCPQCKNPFLVEFQASPTEKGLKCPRASCTFSQNDLMDPAVKAAQQAERQGGTSGDEVPKKKKRLVRRVKRRR